jgi:histone arginine demethylase JMJD6
MTFQVERRANLSYEEFAERYMWANTPVIVTDAIHRWRALSRWSPQFFQIEYGDMQFSVDDSDGQSERSQFTMAQFIDAVLTSTNENPAPYFRNRVLSDEFPALQHDIEPLPKYVFPNWLLDYYFVGSVRKTFNRGAAIELYIGGRGGFFPMLHYDGAASHAFLMQISGRKQFTLYSPDQEPLLYPSKNKQNISMINSIVKPDLERFPLFAKAVPTIFVLEPGETVFIPSRWWHTTYLLTPCITISINVVNESNWKAVVAYGATRTGNGLVGVAARLYLTAGGTWRIWRDRNVTWRHAAPSTNPSRRTVPI